MKNTITVLYLFLAANICCLLTLVPAKVQADDLEGQGQLLLAYDETFVKYGISEDVLGGVNTHVGAFLSLRAPPVLLWYIGPQFTILNYGIKLKTMSGKFVSTDGGIDIIASLWYNQQFLYNLGLSLQADGYFPIDGEGRGHDIPQYYTYTNFFWETKKGSGPGIGIVWENFFSKKEFSESAVGPELRLKRANIWLAYDFTPEITGDINILFRFSLELPNF